MAWAAGDYRATWIASERRGARSETLAADLLAICLFSAVGLFLTGVFFALGFPTV
jgi:hypothetical protein